MQLPIQHADIVCIKIGKMYQNRRFFEYLNIISLQAGRSTYCMTINGMLLKACFPIGLATSSFADFSRRCYTDGTRRWYAELSREGLRAYSGFSAVGKNRLIFCQFLRF